MGRVVFLDSRDAIIRGAFGTGFMISKLVDGHHFVIVGEHHNLVE